MGCNPKSESRKDFVCAWPPCSLCGLSTLNISFALSLTVGDIFAWPVAVEDRPILFLICDFGSPITPVPAPCLKFKSEVNPEWVNLCPLADLKFSGSGDKSLLKVPFVGISPSISR